MHPKQKVFLFDIDGVLVEPHGYRGAVLSTLRYFTDQFGIPATLLPDEEIIILCEANQITSEWDMVPICLAILLENILVLNPGITLPSSMRQITNLSAERLPSVIDYEEPIRFISGHLHPGTCPAEIALSLAMNATLEIEKSRPFLLQLGEHSLIHDLLSNTRDTQDCRTTRIFQHYSLGSDVFSQVYHGTAEFYSPSLLAISDRPQISAEIAERLKIMQKEGKLSLCAYTLRPSLPPIDLQMDLYGFAPEAEMALSLVHLDHIPLIGYGRMRYLANQVGVEPDPLLKPSPVQALAAIFASFNGSEWEALLTAYYLVNGENHIDNFPIDYFENLIGNLPELDIHVFEDTAGGMQAVRNAARILSSNGVKCNTNYWGITRNKEKERALKLVNAAVLPSINEAVERGLKT